MGVSLFQLRFKKVPKCWEGEKGCEWVRFLGELREFVPRTMKFSKFCSKKSDHFIFESIASFFKGSRSSFVSQAPRRAWIQTHIKTFSRPVTVIKFQWNSSMDFAIFGHQILFEVVHGFVTCEYYPGSHNFRENGEKTCQSLLNIHVIKNCLCHRFVWVWGTRKKWQRCFRFLFGFFHQALLWKSYGKLFNCFELLNGITSKPKLQKWKVVSGTNTAYRKHTNYLNDIIPAKEHREARDSCYKVTNMDFGPTLGHRESLLGHCKLT